VISLRRRLQKLESQLTDSTRLIPYSEEWLKYWEQKIYRVLTGLEEPPPGKIPLDALRAVYEYAQTHPSLLDQIVLGLDEDDDEQPVTE